MFFIHKSEHTFVCICIPSIVFSFNSPVNIGILKYPIYLLLSVSCCRSGNFKHSVFTRSNIICKWVRMNFEWKMVCKRVEMVDLDYGADVESRYLNKILCSILVHSWMCASRCRVCETIRKTIRSCRKRLIVHS